MTLATKFTLPHDTHMKIYKILRFDEWQDLTKNGQSQGAPIDMSDGFIHFSTAAQVQETAAKHFAGEDGLILATLDADALGDALKWEVSRGGDLFPHLYAPLRLADIQSHMPLTWDGTAHQFPDDLGAI